MFIGIGKFEIFIPASASLKDKRQVVRSISNVVRKKFNVSIAEVDFLDLWQRSAFGVSCTSGSASHCAKVLGEVERSIMAVGGAEAELVARSVQVVALDDL